MTRDLCGTTGKIDLLFTILLSLLRQITRTTVS